MAPMVRDGRSSSYVRVTLGSFAYLSPASIASFSPVVIALKIVSKAARSAGTKTASTSANGVNASTAETTSVPPQNEEGGVAWNGMYWARKPLTVARVPTKSVAGDVLRVPLQSRHLGRSRPQDSAVTLQAPS